MARPGRAGFVTRRRAGGQCGRTDPGADSAAADQPVADPECTGHSDRPSPGRARCHASQRGAIAASAARSGAGLSRRYAAPAARRSRGRVAGSRRDGTGRRGRSGAQAELAAQWLAGLVGIDTGRLDQRGIAVELAVGRRVGAAVRRRCRQGAGASSASGVGSGAAWLPGVGADRAAGCRRRAGRLARRSGTPGPPAGCQHRGSQRRTAGAPALQQRTDRFHHRAGHATQPAFGARQRGQREGQPDRRSRASVQGAGRRLATRKPDQRSASTAAAASLSTTSP